MVSKEDCRFLSSVKLEYLKKHVSGLSVLDVGAGRCYYSKWLSKHSPERTITAIDKLDLENKDYSGFKYVKYDLEKSFPFQDQTFDTILAFDVIEHIENEKQIAREIYRVAKTGGIIIGSVPHDNDGFLPAYNLTFKHRKDLTHKRYYTEECLEKTLADSGFSEVLIGFHGNVQPQIFAEFFPHKIQFLIRKTIGLMRRIGIINTQRLSSDLFFIAKKATR
jgi:2-polyprenyl-3-methyl-5-hydroxy-6-metoxy-1,4-benzoquinol methylase